MGLLGGIAGVIGAGSAKKALKKGMKAQLEYLGKGIGEQRRFGNQVREDFGTYRDGGADAFGSILDLLGLNGGEQQGSAIEALKNSPYFRSLYDTGEEAILANAAATGGIRGGNTQGFLADFGADTLAKTIQQQLANLGGIADLGFNATNATSGYGQSAADSITNLFAAQGQAKAGYYGAKAGINAGMWNNIGATADKLASKLF